MHMHMPVLYKFAKIFTNYKENPAPPPFPRNIPTPLNWKIQIIQSNPPPPQINFFSFSKFCCEWNKYFGIEIPENKFSGRAHAENNLSR